MTDRSHKPRMDSRVVQRAWVVALSIGLLLMGSAVAFAAGALPGAATRELSPITADRPLEPPIAEIVVSVPAADPPVAKQPDPGTQAAPSPVAPPATQSRRPARSDARPAPPRDKSSKVKDAGDEQDDEADQPHDDDDNHKDDEHETVPPNVRDEDHADDDRDWRDREWRDSDD